MRARAAPMAAPPPPLSPAPDAAEKRSRGEREEAQTLLQKTELCEHWARGHCKFAQSCHFAHGAAELRSRKRPKLYKTKLCQKFLSQGGVCPYAARWYVCPPFSPSDPYAGTHQNSLSTSLSQRRRACVRVCVLCAQQFLARLQLARDATCLASHGPRGRLLGRARHPRAAPQCRKQGRPRAALWGGRCRAAGGRSAIAATTATRTCFAGASAAPTTVASRQVLGRTLTPTVAAAMPTPIVALIRTVRIEQLRQFRDATTTLARGGAFGAYAGVGNTGVWAIGVGATGVGATGVGAFCRTSRVACHSCVAAEPRQATPGLSCAHCAHVTLGKASAIAAVATAARAARPRADASSTRNASRWRSDGRGGGGRSRGHRLARRGGSRAGDGHGGSDNNSDERR
jgi:hypothetical protein